MGTIANALSWSGSGAMLSMFVVSSHRSLPVQVAFALETTPTLTRRYTLEDQDDVLRGRRVVEYDLSFAELPSALDSLLTQCLEAARASGAEVAWFGFEGSFDFGHLLSADIAPVVYAVMDAEGVALASDASLSSTAWQQRIVRAGERARGDRAPRQ